MSAWTDLDYPTDLPRRERPPTPVLKAGEVMSMRFAREQTVIQLYPEPEGVDVGDVETEDASREIRLTAASRFPLRRVRWVWEGRMALGCLSLLAGREGLGKSTIAYWQAARLSRGELAGEFAGHPKSVLVCATEDSWNHTIAPRLHAAGADLDRVFRVDVVEGGQADELSLPRDLRRTHDAAQDVDAGLLLLDPLLSRLDGKLDSHKDAEVRRALEPLVAMADSAKIAVLGLIHLNKSAGTDAMNAVMASRAFTAVARSVSVVVPDADDDSEQRRLFGTPKNNLGPTDLALLPYTIVGHAIDSDDGVIWTGRVDWDEPVTGSIGAAMERSSESREARSAVEEAGDWLEDHLAMNGGESTSKDAKTAGLKEGHSADSLKRAVRNRQSLDFKTARTTPRRTLWYLVPEFMAGAS